MRKIADFFYTRKKLVFLLLLVLLIGICLGIVSGGANLDDDTKSRVEAALQSSLRINRYAYWACFFAVFRLFTFVYICGLIKQTNVFSILILLFKGYGLGASSALLIASIGWYGAIVALIYLVVDVVLLLPPLLWFVLQSFRVYDNRYNIKKIWTIKFTVITVVCTILAFIDAYLVPVFVVKLIGFGVA